ncbi:MAG: hypothetical protein KatS3mg068_0644 [Candidatus Sericytochromatia bacterium]|nr:MAG: hypothetical protein KatS3mg068_0644 [Candidatus Sericytochromatia bacterium]
MFKKNFFYLFIFTFSISCSNIQSINKESIFISSIENKNKNIEMIYAPIINFDSQETHYITSIEKYVEMGLTLKGKNKIGFSKKFKTITNANELSMYVDKSIDGFTLYLDSNDKVSDFDRKVYTRKVIKNDYIYLQYWFFYSYNDTKGIGGNFLIHKCGNHQADWEHIGIKINSSKFNTATNNDEYISAIEEIYFSQHAKKSHIERKFKKPKDVIFKETHVNVFSARGTHASYAKPHQGKGYFLHNVLGMNLYDKADGRGLKFETENYLQDLESSSWSKFGGRWGKIDDDYCNLIEWFSDASNDGPYGPLQQIPSTDWD